MGEPEETSHDGLNWPDSYQDLHDVVTKQWSVTDDIYLTRLLSGGKSGALVYLADVTSADFNGQAILKFDHSPDPAGQEKSEAERHANAYAAAPEFAEAHLPKILHTAHDENGMALLSTVAGRGLEFAAPWSQSDYEQQFDVAKRLSGSILEDWNRNAKMAEGMKTPQTLLRGWLGRKLDPARSRLHETVNSICGIPPEEPSFLFEGTWYPNPLAFCLADPQDFSDYRLRAIKGHIHGDLHGLNVLISQTGQTRNEFFLIDLAFYEENQYLFYDHTYFVISLLLSRRGRVSERHWMTIVNALCPYDHLRTNTRLDSDDLGLVNLINLIRQEVLEWVDRNQPHRVSYMESQFQMAQVAASLNFTSKGIDPHLRRLAFLQSASVLKDYMSLHSIDWPRHGPPMSDAPADLPADKVESRASRSSGLSGAPAKSVPLPEKPAIAVLAFENLSGDSSQNYFVDGIADEVIAELSRIDWLMVISRGSSFKYKSSDVDPRTVSKELGVHYVVEGSVLRRGDRVRVSAKLVDAQDGEQLWAERFDRETDDIFDLQQDIATSIAARVDTQVSFTQREAAKNKSGDVSIWEGFQKAMWHARRFNEDDSDLAYLLLSELSSKAPNNSQVKAALSILKSRKLMMGETENFDVDALEAFKLAKEAVNLDENNSFARLSLSRICSMQGKFDEALFEAKMAIDRNPSSSIAYANLSAVLLWGGHLEEAMAAIDTSIRLSPRGPSLRRKLFVKAILYYFMGNYEEAERLFSQATMTGFLAPFTCLFLSAVYLRQDRKKEAKAALKQALEQRPDFSKSMLNQFWKTMAPEFRDKVLGDLRKVGLQD